MRLEQLERNRRTKVKKSTSLNVINLPVCHCLRYAYNFRLTFWCLWRNAKGIHLYIRWAYKQGGGGGLISGIISSLANGWAYIRRGFNVGFYGILTLDYWYYLHRIVALTWVDVIKGGLSWIFMLASTIIVDIFFLTILHVLVYCTFRSI